MDLIYKEAVISLLGTNCGGRTNAIVDGYSPNIVYGVDLNSLSHLWGENKNIYDTPDSNERKNCGTNIYIQKGQINPGSLDVVKLGLTQRSFDYLGAELLKSGTKFLLREGVNIVGFGVML